jgi:hypothetical protein
MAEKMNLYQKMHAVMEEVQYLSKDDSINAGKFSYKAISEEKVTSTVRAALIKHGLVIFPVEQQHTKESNLTTVNTLYKIVDIENGSYETLASSGTGQDNGDKGVGKAMTYSFKYLLLRSFMIPTGEDPDKIASVELEKQDVKKLFIEKGYKAEQFAGWYETLAKRGSDHTEMKRILNEAKKDGK